MARRRPDEEAADLAPGRRADLVSGSFEERPDRAFEQLQADVARETVADDDVAGAAKEVPALDVPAEVQVGCDEECVCLQRELVAFLGLLADREEPHLGI